MEQVDVAIIGGGIIGLAVATEVVSRGHGTCLLETRPQMGMEASTHNSGVIHAGIYYPEGSLKARLCVEGRDLLYRFCAQHEIPHRRCGKLIISTNEPEVSRLEALLDMGRRNGVDDLAVVDRQFVAAREPAFDAHAALWSPSTGILEAEGLVRTLASLATDREVVKLPDTPVLGGGAVSHGIELRTPRERILARAVVNAAGLYADEVSARLGGMVFTIYPVRGEYAELIPTARPLVKGLVYPLPEPTGHGLGVHFTRNIWDAVTLGPTATYRSRKDDYESERLALDVFFESARRMLPSLTPTDLRPGGTGLRAKASPPEVAFADFIIQHDPHVPGLIHAAGIDSPGLTSCLAIARTVSGLVADALR